MGGVINDITALLGAIAATCVGLISNNDLMNQGFVVLTTEQHIRSLQTAGFLALFINKLEFHYAPALTAGRTITSDPLEPGTAPLTSNS